jgi:acetyl-CoA carboxylase biotin carboxyl carrier protein
VFEVGKVRRFIELMDEYELTEIDLRQGEQRIRLRRGGTTAPVFQSSQPLAGQIPVTTPAESTNPPTVRVADVVAATYIRSPIVGTFYASPSPEAAPFVKVGDHVGPETIVCIVEAMKVFNEIPAEASGRIAAVLVENGDAVEFGQTLFRIDPST